MTTHHFAARPMRAMAGVGIVLATGLALTACANPLQGVVDSVSSSAADSFVSEMTDGQVQGLGSSEIPADFPQSVPLPNVEPTSALRYEEDGKTVWMLQYGEGINASDFETLLAGLASNGFAEESSGDLGGAMRIAVYNSGEFMVNASLMGTDDDEQIMQVMVSPVGS